MQNQFTNTRTSRTCSMQERLVEKEYTSQIPSSGERLRGVVCIGQKLESREKGEMYSMNKVILNMLKTKSANFCSKQFM